MASNKEQEMLKATITVKIQDSQELVVYENNFYRTSEAESLTEEFLARISATLTDTGYDLRRIEKKEEVK